MHEACDLSCVLSPTHITLCHSIERLCTADVFIGTVNDVRCIVFPCAQVQLAQSSPQAVHQHYEDLLRGVREKSCFASQQLLTASQMADRNIRYSYVCVCVCMECVRDIGLSSLTLLPCKMLMSIIWIELCYSIVAYWNSFLIVPTCAQTSNSDVTPMNIIIPNVMQWITVHWFLVSTCGISKVV